MDYEIDRRGGVSILRMKGTVHGDDSADLSATIGRLKREECKRVVIDASEIDYINSRGIGELVGFLQHMISTGGKVVLVKPNPSVMKILDSVGLASIIKVFDSADLAIASFGSTRSN